MNTLDATTAFIGKFVDQARVNTNRVNLDATNIVAQSQAKLDAIAAPAANEQLVSKVLADNVKRTINIVPQSKSPITPIKDSAPDSSSNVNAPVRSEKAFALDSGEVSEQIKRFVQKGLAQYASEGASAERLSELKDKAIEGIELGVEQALNELKGVGGDQIIQQLKELSANVVKNVSELSVLPSDYTEQAAEKSTPIANGFDQFRLETRIGEQFSIDFKQSSVFDTELEDGVNRFTTATSNISYSLSSEIDSSKQSEIAVNINQLDKLVSQFYRADVQGALKRAESAGYDLNEITSLRKQVGGYNSLNAISAYESTQHNSNGESFKAALEVAKYLENLDLSVANSERIFGDKETFNELINGIVNQMEDVQVPDLLQAIARFHSFNSRFIG